MAIDKIQQMQEMIAQLNQASDAYYNGQGEQMTDYEWDHLFDQLKMLEKETGVVLEASPTHNVSADTFSGKKEEHEYAALSLAKTKNIMDLVKWAEGRPIWLSWKLDGLTLVVTFDEGKLTKVVTRGNGHIGTNITHLASAIAGIPKKIKSTGHVVIRGECVISYSDFEEFLLESGEDYANPRNLASGSLTLKDVEEVKLRHLQWIPFTLVHVDEPIDRWGDRMDFIEANGMKAVERERIENPTEENIQKVIDRWTLKVTHRDNPFPVDGLVIAYDDYAYSLTGSVTGHHATRAGYAFKWQDESAETELDHIEWSCAASTISPVAVFRPVELEGTTVKRASLCNVSECERLGIGDAGTKLSVIKSNKIIPKVIHVIDKVGNLTIPDKCPVCGAPTRVVESESSGTRTLHCTNETCPAKQLRKFARFVSKDGMNIDGISAQTISKFINLGWVKEYADIYHLREHIFELSMMEGFGQKSAANIMRSIDKSREVDARRFLYALSIPLVGKDVCKRLLGARSLEEIIKLSSPSQGGELFASQEGDLFSEDTREAIFASIDGIGPEKSASVVRFFSNPKNLRIVEHLMGELTIREDSMEPTGEKCKDLVFVVTGDVHHYKNRNALKAYIESQGGKVTGSVSKNTNYLINNDVESVSSKNQKAHQLNIPIISEEEFINKFGEE